MNKGDIVKYINQEGEATVVAVQLNTIIVVNEYGFEEELDASEVMLSPKQPMHIEIPYFSENLVATQTTKNIIQKSKEKIIDLHFTQLVDYPNQYTAHQKLKYQLEYAHKVIEEYRLKTEKLILIHGKGKGVLEQEILQLLASIPRIKYFDADFRRFKLGAVAIKYI